MEIILPALAWLFSVSLLLLLYISALLCTDESENMQQQNNMQVAAPDVAANQVRTVSSCSESEVV